MYEQSVQEKQVLEYCVGTEDPLYYTSINSYEGSLYALSYFRQQLLSRGYTERVWTQSSDLLDTILSGNGERVRLIYQSNGSIRIVFENQAGAAHILLEEMWP